MGKQGDVMADQHRKHSNALEEGRNSSTEETLLAKFTPSVKAGNRLREPTDGGDKDRPGQSLPVGRAAAFTSGQTGSQKPETK